jgi:hypothetical protein
MRISALRIGIIVALCFCAYGQNPPAKDPQVNETKGLPPRAAPADYQAQAQAGTVTIAAEFMGHSVPTPQGVLSTEEFVVVETAMFGPPDARIKLSIEDFSVRINEKKTPAPSQPYGLVLKSLKDPDWEPPPSPEKPKTSFGSGGGRGKGADGDMPVVVHVPIEVQRAMAQRVQKASLPEGDRPLPQAGLLFFQYRGKTQGIHSIELIYSGAAGKATLTLQP